MIKHEYVNVKFKSKFAGVISAEHRDIIDDYARRGYKYVGYIPTKQIGYGMIKEIDLIFELNTK